MRFIALLIAAGVSILVIATGQAGPASASGNAVTPPVIRKDAASERDTRARVSAGTAAAKACQAAGKTCIEVTRAPAPSKETIRRLIGRGKNKAVVSYPTWCADAPFGDFIGTRRAVCRSDSWLLTVTRTQNGVVTVIGTLSVLSLEYHYGDAALNNTVLQAGLAAYAGSGDYAGMTVTGRATPVSGCTAQSQSFVTQSLLPLNSGYKSGDAGFLSTATATGAVATCTARWTLTVAKPNATPATLPLANFGQMRCDNAISGKVAGCVVPWAPEIMRFSSTNNPNIVSHIKRAQASGLPGTVGGATNSQGGITSGFYKSWRVLDGDPLWVSAV